MREPRIYSYSVVYTSSVDFNDKTPYACAIIEDADGQRASCILEGYVVGSEVKVGMPVKELGKNEDGTLCFGL